MTTPGGVVACPPSRDRGGLRAGDLRAGSRARARGHLVCREAGRWPRGHEARPRAPARWPRRQHGDAVHRRRYRPRPGHAGEGEGPCARDDHVPEGQPAAGARRTGAAPRSVDAAACTWRRSTCDRAADCRGVGLRVPEPDERAGRQWRGADARHHRPGEQRPAAEAGRLGRSARVGLGRGARARLPGNRSRGRRHARGHRGRLALRQGGPRHDGVRAALCGRPGRLVRQGRRDAAPAQLRRGGREPDRIGRVPLDGRQLPEVRRGRVSLSAAGTPAICRSTRTS